MVVGNGVTVTPDGRFEDCLAPDVVVVPELSVGNDASLLQDLSPEVAWLRRWYGAGATIATACSGAVVLAETGLLDGQSATTHWAYCDGLQERHPDIHVQGDRALVVAGEGQRLLMAGGGASWMDMALFLISRLLGVEAAVRMARLNLIDWHDVGQQPFASLARTRQRAEEHTSELQSLMRISYAVFCLKQKKRHVIRKLK